MTDVTRVLVLTEMYPRRTGPATGIFVHRENLALKRAGFEVRVVCPIPYAPRLLWNNPKWRRLGMIPHSDNWGGVSVRYPRYIRPPGRLYRKFEPFAMFPGLCSSFLAWSKERRFDLIHAHGLLPGGMAAVLLSRAFHLPCVCHARGSDVNIYPDESKVNYLLTRYVIEHCDVPVATSRALAGTMSRISRIPRQIRVVYKSVDEQHFVSGNDRSAIRRRLGLPFRSFVVLFVGSVSHDKGIEELSGAWEHVSQKLSEGILAVIGDGPLTGKLASLASSVRVEGSAPNAEVALWMQASDVLVLPSHNEGLPNVVLEAMACGLPVIATRVGGVPEAIIHEENGLLVPVGDPQGIASAILRLAGNRDLCRSMGESGRGRIQTLFNWGSYVSGIRDIYRSALEAHSSGKADKRGRQSEI